MQLIAVATRSPICDATDWYVQFVNLIVFDRQRRQLISVAIRSPICVATGEFYRIFNYGIIIVLVAICSPTRFRNIFNRKTNVTK